MTVKELIEKLKKRDPNEELDILDSIFDGIFGEWGDDE